MSPSPVPHSPILHLPVLPTLPLADIAVPGLRLPVMPIVSLFVSRSFPPVTATGPGRAPEFEPPSASRSTVRATRCKQCGTCFARLGRA